jgi:hypothetical protein
MEEMEERRESGWDGSAKEKEGVVLVEADEEVCRVRCGNMRLEEEFDVAVEVLLLLLGESSLPARPLRKDAAMVLLLRLDDVGSKMLASGRAG